MEFYICVGLGSRLSVSVQGFPKLLARCSKQRLVRERVTVLAGVVERSTAPNTSMQL